MELTKGNRSVSDYEREFTRLSKYMSVLVASDKAKALHFIEGLIPPLRKIIRRKLITEYRRAVNIDTTMEEDHKKV